MRLTKIYRAFFTVLLVAVAATALFINCGSSSDSSDKTGTVSLTFQN